MVVGGIDKTLCTGNNLNEFLKNTAFKVGPSFPNILKSIIYNSVLCTNKNDDKPTCQVHWDSELTISTLEWKR